MCGVFLASGRFSFLDQEQEEVTHHMGRHPCNRTGHSSATSLAMMLAFTSALGLEFNCDRSAGEEKTAFLKSALSLVFSPLSGKQKCERFELQVSFPVPGG